MGEAAGDAAGLAAVAAPACLRARFDLGEAAGEAADEGDAAVSAAEAVFSAFLCARCFVGSCAGDAPGLGDCSCAIQVPTNPTTAMRAEIFVIIAARVRSRGVTVNPILRHTEWPLFQRPAPSRISARALERGACLGYGLAGCST